MPFGIVSVFVFLFFRWIQVLNNTFVLIEILSRYGLTFMLLASLAAGLFFTVLVWVDSHTWIYIRKR